MVVFPGSNCEHDSVHAWQQATGGCARLVWHEEETLGDADAVILPGGFAHGDYLRAGALCRFSRVMQAVRRAADDGLPVLGICNGFQILCEAGLLPGALGRNRGLRFVCQSVQVRTETSATAWTGDLAKGEVLTLPIAHGEGCFWLPPEEHRALVRRGGVVFRYTTTDGGEGGNPNGSLDGIAGVCNPAGNVVGLMPHPERAAEALLGGIDGGRILRSALRWVEQRVVLHG